MKNALGHRNQNLYLMHSNYYRSNSLPFASPTYWIVIDENNDMIPVCTQGYKTHQSAKRVIQKYLGNIQQMNLIYEQTKEEYDNEVRQTIRWAWKS